MDQNIHQYAIVCPECRSRELHMEYESYGCKLLLRVCQKTVEDVPAEDLCCYCKNCGLVFYPASQSMMADRA